MPKATITVDEHPPIVEVRDGWDDLVEAVTEVVGGAIWRPDKPETITITIAGMTMAEWNALPEETRRDFQEYGAEE
jgi:hypothetical protein